MEASVSRSVTRRAADEATAEIEAEHAWYTLRVERCRAVVMSDRHMVYEHRVSELEYADGVRYGLARALQILSTK